MLNIERKYLQEFIYIYLLKKYVRLPCEFFVHRPIQESNILMLFVHRIESDSC